MLSYRLLCSPVAAIVALLFPALASAQTAWVLDAAGVTHPVHTPSAANPVGAVSPLGPRPLRNFIAAIGAPVPPPAGGHAIDQQTFTVYSTDGFVIQTDVHPPYVLFRCPGGGICQPPPAVAAPLLLGGGPLTGLAVDAVGGVLYMCDAVSFQAFALNIVPVPIPLGPALPLPAPGPVSGLGFESGNGTLWATTIFGGLTHFTPAGVVLGVFPPVILPVGPITGLAINETQGQPGDTAPPNCSQQLVGYHVVVTDGVFLYDAQNALLPPIPTGVPGLAYGLAFSHDPQLSRAASPQNRAQIYTTRPTYTGAGPIPGLVFGIRVFVNNAATPIGPVLLIDACAVAPIPSPWGGVLRVNPATALVIAMPPEPSLPGSYRVRLPVNLNAGLQASAQCVYFDPMAPPAQISLTDCLTLTIGRP